MEASATRTRLVPDLSSGPVWETRVKAIRVPSGEKAGSMSQSRGARPSSRSRAGAEPSASVSQMRATRAPCSASNRVTTICRPSGV